MLMRVAEVQPGFGKGKDRHGAQAQSQWQQTFRANPLTGTWWRCRVGSRMKPAR